MRNGTRKIAVISTSVYADITDYDGDVNKDMLIGDIGVLICTSSPDTRLKYKPSNEVIMKKSSENKKHQLNVDLVHYLNSKQSNEPTKMA